MEYVLDIVALVGITAYLIVTELTSRRYRRTAEDALATTDSALKAAAIANATAEKSVETTRVALAALKLAKLSNGRAG
ncbi:MAG: hypothetical protein ACRBN8_22575 [Nannocystales bacterium]